MAKNEEKENELTYKGISKKRRLAKEKEDLIELEDSFYKLLSKYIREKMERFREKKDKGEGKLGDKFVKKLEREIKNTRKMIRDIYDKRESKIVFKASSAVRRDVKVDDTTSMLPYEENLYYQIKETLEKYRENILGLVLLGEYGGEKKEGNKKMVQMKEDVPQFIWKKNKKYGPFKKKEVVNLPKELGQFLIEKGKAEEV